MSYGKVYFARNSTGVKLGFTKKSIKKGINDNCNLSMVVDSFTLIEYITVKKPKSVKALIASELLNKNINKDLYNLTLTNDSINKLCNKYRQNLDEDSDYESDDEGSESDNSDSEESELDDVNDEEFIVEKIVSYIGNVKNPHTLLFTVKWVGYPSYQNTMKPFKNLKDCIIFQEYINKTPSLHFLKGKITNII
jgi:hypothetical protein